MVLYNANMLSNRKKTHEQTTRLLELDPNWLQLKQGHWLPHQNLETQIAKFFVAALSSPVWSLLLHLEKCWKVMKSDRKWWTGSERWWNMWLWSTVDYYQIIHDYCRLCKIWTVSTWISIIDLSIDTKYKRLQKCHTCGGCVFSHMFGGSITCARGQDCARGLE